VTFRWYPGSPVVIAVETRAPALAPIPPPPHDTMTGPRPTAAAFVGSLPLGWGQPAAPRPRSVGGTPLRPPAGAAVATRTTAGRRSRLVAFTEPPPPPPTDADVPLSLRPEAMEVTSSAPIKGGRTKPARGLGRWAFPTDQKLSFFDWHLVFGLFTVAVVERTTTALSSPSLIHSAQAAFVMAVTALVYRIRA